MKLKKWRALHKWTGLAICLFLMMFVASGIILNHRNLVLDKEINRSWLPARYEFRNWNGGLMRGTLPYGNDVLIYGTNGIWKQNSVDRAISDFNHGLPRGADRHNIRRIVNAGNSGLMAVSPFGAYHFIGNKWEPISLPVEDDEKLTDIEVCDDSIVIAGRSHLYVATESKPDFRKLTLSPSPDSEGKVTLLRIIWCLHSGELFGLPGRIVVDAIGITFLFLCISGIAIWIVRKRRPGTPIHKWNSRWHNKIGFTALALLILLALTGWCLRPPVMVPLALTHTKPIPGTALASDNAWHDKIRAIRRDTLRNDWILSTSEGFFSIKNLSDTPRKIKTAPPVSVMGVTVLQQDEDGSWICGSLSGLYRWNRDSGEITDWFSGEKADLTPGPPFGKKPVSGFSQDLLEKPVIVDYVEGTENFSQPEKLAQLPMSLHNVALEVHSGRIYIGNIATYVFVFIAGIIVMLCIYSGYKIHYPIRKKKKHNNNPA